MEREKKQNNLVIMGVPEKEDENKIREYCSNLLMEVTDEENVEFEIWEEWVSGGREQDL